MRREPEATEAKRPAVEVELQELLTQIRQEGTRESSGRFTIDFLSARHKLARFALQDPSQSLLCLIQSAIVGGATHVELRRKRHLFRTSFQVTHDGTPLSEMERLAHVLMHPLEAAEPHVRRFSMGFNAVAETGRSLEVLSGRAPEGLHFRLEAGELQIDRHPLENLQPVTRIDIGPGVLTSLDTTRLAYAGVPVTLNAKLLNRPYFGRPQGADFRPGHWDLGPIPWPIGQAEWYLFAPQAAPGLLSVPRKTKCKLRRYQMVGSLLADELDVPVPEPPLHLTPWTCQGDPLLSCHAMLTLTSKSHSELHWVRHGVVISTERNVLERNGLVAIASAQELALDVSGFEVVHDENYRKVLALLKKGCLWMYSD